MRLKADKAGFPFHYRYCLSKGFTLVELLAVLGLFSIVAVLGLSFYISSTKVMVQGSRQSDLQYNIALTSKAITDELLYASDIKLHPTIPASFDTSRRYVYVQNNAIKHMKNGNTSTVYNNSVAGRTYSLSFVSSDGSSLDFTVATTEAGQNYNIQSKVRPLNLGSIPITAGTGPVISYKTTSNRITYFALIKEGSKNNKLTNSVYGYIEQPTGNTPETAGEISLGITPNSNYNSQSKLTDLIPTFIGTGSSVKVNSVIQQSGTTVQSFAANPETNPVIYTSVADDGTQVYYKVKIKLLASNKPQAAYVGIYNYNADIKPSTWVITEPEQPGYPPEPGSFIVAGGDVVKFAYKYDANGSDGSEGLTTYELLQNSAADTNTFNPINYYLAPPGAGIKRNGVISFRVPDDGISYSGKAYKIRVTAVSKYGEKAIIDVNNTDFGGYSRNAIVLKDDSMSNFMKDFVNQDNVLLRYQATQKAIFDTEGVAFIINTTADNSNGGSNLLKPFVEYIPDGDDTTYKIIVDAKLEPPPTDYSPGGYGVLVGGNVPEPGINNYDNGYMIQFDPGAEGFLIRKMVNGNHDPSKMYGVNKIYKPADFCYGSNSNSNGYKFRYATCKNGNASNFDWYKRYTMEILVQKHATTSTDMTMRVRLYYTNPVTKEIFYSNDMWFGDFGSIKYDQTFNGVAGTNSLGLNGTSSMVGSYLGIRTWVNKKKPSAPPNPIPNKFYNIDIKSGFTLYVNSAFTAQDKIKLDFYQIEDGVIKSTASDKRREGRSVIYKNSTFNSSLIKILVGDVTPGSPNTDKYPYSFEPSSNNDILTDIITLGLKKPPYLEELTATEGIPSALNTEKGAFRQQYAGLVRIVALPADYTKKDETKPTFSSTKASSFGKTITVTFSEPMVSRDALALPENYTLSSSLYSGCSLVVQDVSSSREGFYPDTVTLSVTKGSSGIDYFRSGTTVTKINNVTDVAGNGL